jgi:phospholipid/cholesterol/gamma-HCH transport system substrate-binding protein
MLPAGRGPLHAARGVLGTVSRLLERLRSIPSFRDLNKLAVGLVGIALSAAVVASLFAVGTLGIFDNSYRMAGVFAESGGLKTGAPVRIAGIQVGKVKTVSPDFQAGQVVISWTVRHGVHVGPTTIAEIGTSTLLGGDFLRLSSTEGGTSFGDLPRAQRRIPLERTRVPYTVINAFGDVSNKIRTLDIPTFNDVVHQAAGALRRNGAGLPQLVDDLSTLGNAVSARQQQLDDLITSGQQLTSTLASRDQQLGQLIDQAGGLLDALDSRHQQISTLLGSSSSVANQLADLIAQKRASIDAIARNVHDTLGAIDHLEPAINDGLSKAGPTLTALAAVAGPNQFNIEITGVGPASLANLNAVLNLLLTP